MADPLLDLLTPYLKTAQQQDGHKVSSRTSAEASTKYLSRVMSLRLSDLTTTEPQSLSQATHSNHVSLQALSSRSHRTTTASAAHLSTLQSSLPSISRSTNEVRESIPALDESAVSFASTYARSRDVENPLLQARKNSMLLAQQSDKLTDILDLPSLLSTAIASAGSGAAGSTNYGQALDLFAHIKRLSIVYPDSALVKSVQAEAEDAMKSMTANLLSSLRSQNIRLAAAIRTIGWLRRVVPSLSNQPQIPHADRPGVSGTMPLTLAQQSTTVADATQTEGSYGALFLVSRLHTFITVTEALAPLRDLADQETEGRVMAVGSAPSNQNAYASRRPSSTTTTSSHGTQTERYLKRYIEIFREQSFNTISMYRNIFPSTDLESESMQTTPKTNSMTVPSALQQFPMHLVEMFMETLTTYLPNVKDPTARESLLMQVLYAANSLGRLGADFSMMISLLIDDDDSRVAAKAQSEVEKNAAEGESEERNSAEEGDANEGNITDDSEPEWARVIKKHRIQAARLDALAAGREQTSRPNSDLAVR